MGKLLLHIANTPLLTISFTMVMNYTFQIVRQLQRRLDNYAATQVMPLNQPDDPRAYPEYHDGLWEPWED